MKVHLLSLLCLLSCAGLSQSFTSYFTGNTDNIETNPNGGSVLMGGATENDNAMRWFLNRADGGDVLILRASGSDGYNDYLFSELGVPVNSVETIVFHEAVASNDTYIMEKIAQAEAIWFAGGDQWNYVDYWRGTNIQFLINEAIAERNIVIGGTSAGMAILGGFYFSAINGTITSNQAIFDPYDENLTVDSSSFLDVPFLDIVITDTHFDSPDRRGRLMAFLARIYTDYGIEARAIASEEYTAVCVDEHGETLVFGNHPANQDFAYFVQFNCEIPDASPEQCQPMSTLVWNRNGEALKVVKVKASATGTAGPPLSTWQEISTLNWENWSIAINEFQSSESEVPICEVLNTVSKNNLTVQLYPNPSRGLIHIDTDIKEDVDIILYNQEGKIWKEILSKSSINLTLDLSMLPSGFYILQMNTKNDSFHLPCILTD